MHVFALVWSFEGPLARSHVLSVTSKDNNESEHRKKATSIVLQLQPRPLFYKPSYPSPSSSFPIVLWDEGNVRAHIVLRDRCELMFTLKRERTNSEMLSSPPETRMGNHAIAINEEATVVRTLMLLLTTDDLAAIYCRFSLSASALRCR